MRIRVGEDFRRSGIAQDTSLRIFLRFAEEKVGNIVVDGFLQGEND